MSQVLIIKNKGLYTSPNEFSSVPEGGMSVAKNCSIDIDNLLEPRRGNERLLAFPSGSDRARRYAVYQETIIAAYSGGKLARKSGSSWVDYSGTYNDPDSNLAKLRYLPAGSNLYFTSATGVYRLDSATGTPALSGIPKGLDLELALSGSSGYLSNNNQVAYRMVWGFRDANGTVIIGAPSGRAVAINSAGASRDVDIEFSVPEGVTTAYFYQVYRSVNSGGVAVEPSDELALVYENNPTAAEITAGTISFTDSTPDSLRGVTLYTSPSQEGILQANERPPQAADINFFANSVFYADCKSKHRKTLTLISAAALSNDDTITIAGVTYTAKATENIASDQFELATGGTAAQNIADTAESLIRVINRSSSTTDIYAYLLSGQNDLPGQILLEERGIGGDEFTIHVSAAGNAFNPTLPIPTTFTDGDVTTGTDSINITAHGYYTGQRVILTTTGTLPTGLSTGTDYYIVVVDVDNFKLATSLDNANAGTVVNITAASGGGTHTVTPTNIYSSADDFQHQLFFAKRDKPESVPLLNYRFIGSANNRILRIMPLKNSLFIFKEKEGIYRLTGDDPSNFSVDLFDSSARLLAPDSVAVVNNQIWCLSDQGIITVTETGVSVISRPIEDLILEQTGLALNPLRYYSFGVGYETDRKYILWTVSTSSDTHATQAFVWNTFTKAFTKWDITATTAFVSEDDNKLYIGEGSTNYTLQERKSLTYSDIVDYSISVTISSFSGDEVTLSSVTGITAGDVLTQGSISSVILSISGNVLTVADSLGGWTAASASVLKAFEVLAEYTAMTGGNPGTSKQFPEVSLLFKSARFNAADIGFSTDISAAPEYVEIAGSRGGLWGLFPWGQAQWGGSVSPIPIRTYVPLEKQRGSLLRIRFKIKEGYSAWKLNGASVPYRDLNSYKVAK